MINPALEWLAAMDAAEFKRWFQGSPLERTRRKRLQRNVAIAMGNSGEQKFIPQLKAWSVAEDPILAESSEWAIRQIDSLQPHQPIAKQENQASSARPDTQAALPSSQGIT